MVDLMQITPLIYSRPIRARAHDGPGGPIRARPTRAQGAHHGPAHKGPTTSRSKSTASSPSAQVYRKGWAVAFDARSCSTYMLTCIYKAEDMYIHNYKSYIYIYITYNMHMYICTERHMNISCIRSMIIYVYIYCIYRTNKKAAKHIIYIHICMFVYIYIYTHLYTYV